MKKIIMQKAEHRGAQVLCLRFARDTAIENALRTLENCRWSKPLTCWYVPNTPANFKKVLPLLRPFGYVDFSSVVDKKAANPNQPRVIEKKQTKPIGPATLTSLHVEQVETFVKYLRSKRYSDNTIKTYAEALKTFLKFYPNKAAHQLSEDDIIQFNPNYALGMHSLPNGLTKTLDSNVLSRLNPDNENHQLGFLTLGLIR